MPFKSKAQVAKFHELQKQGKISSKEVAKWTKEIKNIKTLPKRIKK